MTRKVKITVLKRECYTDLQQQYLSNPQSGPCPVFHEGQEFIIENNDYWKMNLQGFCRKHGTASTVMCTQPCRAAALWVDGQMTIK